MAPLLPFPGRSPSISAAFASQNSNFSDSTYPATTKSYDGQMSAANKHHANLTTFYKCQVHCQDAKAANKHEHSQKHAFAHTQHLSTRSTTNSEMANNLTTTPTNPHCLKQRQRQNLCLSFVIMSSSSLLLQSLANSHENEFPHKQKSQYMNTTRTYTYEIARQTAASICK